MSPILGISPFFASALASSIQILTCLMFLRSIDVDPLTSYRIMDATAATAAAVRMKLVIAMVPRAARGRSTV